MKIMIIDDSSTMRKILMKSLRQSNITVNEVLEASDGQEGFDQLDDSIDMVFCDINMPNVDGKQFLEMKKDSNYNDIPIIIISTEASQDIISEMKELGACNNIKKPFKVEKIEEIVESCSK